MDDWNQTEQQPETEAQEEGAQETEATDVSSELDAILDNPETDSEPTVEEDAEEIEPDSEVEGEDSEEQAEIEEGPGEDEELESEIEDSELEEEDFEIEDSEDSGLSWDNVTAIFRFVLVAKKANPKFLRALNSIMFNGDPEERISVFQIAQNVSYEDPRTEIATFFSNIFLARINDTETREDIFALADWAHQLDDDSRKSVSPILAAISASFPRYEEELDEGGQPVLDDNGQPKLTAAEPYVPKRTTRKSSGGDILGMVEDTYRSIDHETFREFSDWYAQIIQIWPGVE